MRESIHRQLGAILYNNDPPPNQEEFQYQDFPQEVTQQFHVQAHISVIIN